MLEQVKFSDVYNGESLFISTTKDNILTMGEKASISLGRQDQMRLCMWLARTRETMIETALVIAKEERFEKEREKNG